MSDPTTYQLLAARFSAAEHKSKNIGGTDLTYVDGETVISRLNDALGFDGWSFEVKDIKVLEDEVWALGRLTVYGTDRDVIREQAGGQIINRKRGIPATPARPAQERDGDRPAIPAVEAQPAVKGDIIELANDIKGAVTDCLKKCATLVGVGLYLYDPAARTEVKAEMQAAKRNPTPRPSAAPTPAANPGTQASRSASTPTASGAAPTSSSTTATPAPTEPTPLKTKAELAADLRTGIEYARKLGLDVADVDAAPLNRAEIEETIDALRGQCRAAKAANKAKAS